MRRLLLVLAVVGLFAMMAPSQADASPRWRGGHHSHHGHHHHYGHHHGHHRHYHHGHYHRGYYHAPRAYYGYPSYRSFYSPYGYGRSGVSLYFGF